MGPPDKVSFVVAGAQKAGTTALDQYLRDHPELCLPQRKELRFFDTDRYFVGEPAKRFTYVDRGFYAQQLKRLWRNFPREQTIAFKSEELLASAAAVLATIADFLGIDPFPPVASKTAHARDYDTAMTEDARRYL